MTDSPSPCSLGKKKGSFSFGREVRIQRQPLLLRHRPRGSGQLVRFSVLHMFQFCNENSGQVLEGQSESEFLGASLVFFPHAGSQEAQ